MSEIVEFEFLASMIINRKQVKSILVFAINILLIIISTKYFCVVGGSCQKIRQDILHFYTNKTSHVKALLTLDLEASS